MIALKADQLVKLASILKAGQMPPQFKRKHKHDPLAAAYPAYDKSLLTQLSQDPRQAGTSRALGAGLVAAVSWKRKSQGD